MADLYKYNNKDYSYDDLRRYLDFGFSHYVSSLKGGQKHYLDYFTAYNNLMEGLRDHSIIYKNGSFHDTKGRYWNLDSRKANRDYYGIVARYIANGIGELSAYIDPNKVKYGEDAVKQAFGKYVGFKKGASEAENLKLFHGLDMEDRTKGPSTMNHRLTKVYSFLRDADENFDKYFYDYTPEDRAKFRALRVNFLNAIKNNVIEPNEMLGLNGLFSTTDWDKMMYVGATPYNYGDYLDSPEKFKAYLDLKYPRVLTSDWQLDSDILTDTLRQTLLLSIKNHGRIKELLGSALSNRKGKYSKELKLPFTVVGSDIARAILNSVELKEGGMYPDPIGGKMYFYDAANNIIYEKNPRDVPAYRDQLWNEYKQTHSPGAVGGDDAWIMDYYTLKDKQGAILKYQLPAGALESGVDYNVLKKGWMLAMGEATLQHIKATLERFHKLEESDPTKKGLVERYVQFLNQGQADHAKLNDTYGLYVDKGQAARGKDVGKYLTTYGQGFHDEVTGESEFTDDEPLGYNTYLDLAVQKDYFKTISGKPNGIDTKNQKYQPDSSFGGQTLSRIYLGRTGEGWMSDADVKRWQDEFTGLGLNLDYSPLPGHEEYMHLSFKSDDDTVETPAGGVADDADKKDNIEDDADKKDNTAVHPTDGLLKADLIDPFDINKVWGNFANYTRLPLSLYYNDKIEDILLKGLLPTLKSPYELHLPITGDFAAMLFKNNQAADLRFLASRPLTSDASLLTAYQLEANDLAMKKEEEGRLLDNKHVEESQEKAFALEALNAKLRNAVANANREELADIAQERSAISATRQLKDFNSYNTYLGEVATDALTKAAKDELTTLTLSSTIADARADELKSMLMREFKRAHPDWTDELIMNDSLYKQAMKRVDDSHYAETLRVLRGLRYDVQSNETYDDIYNDILEALFPKEKKYGGTLDLNIMSLIQKVMRDERNSNI